MPETETEEPDPGIDDFLIAEYQHFADSFWRTEELGEKRLNFFISLLTAAVAGLVLLATSENGFTDSQVQWVAFSTALGLFLLGLSTFMRMLRRNEAVDEYKAAMRTVRKSFTDRYRLSGYKPFEKRPRKLFTGGLAQTSALLNSLLAGAVTAIGLLEAMSAALLAALAAIVAGASLAAQFLYIRHRQQERDESQSGEVSAG